MASRPQRGGEFEQPGCSEQPGCWSRLDRVLNYPIRFGSRLNDIVADNPADLVDALGLPTDEPSPDDRSASPFPSL